MKKVICSCIAVLLLCFALNQNAFASTVSTVIEGKDSSGSTSVKGTYAPQEEEVIYCVDVIWGSMEFVYDAGTVQEVWNPETHEYETKKTSGEGWSCAQGANVVTVFNRSNQAIVATVSTTINDAFSAITTKIENGTIKLADASVGATNQVAGTASSGSATITLAGELTDTTAQNKAIGTVTVTISDAETE